MIIQIVTMQYFVFDLLGKNPVNVVLLGGLFLIIGGILTLFITNKVVKPQYISGNEDNNLLGSIDYLYDYLINEVSKGKSYFDFGPSHENNGLNIIKNINFWKESFGAQTLVQNFYEVETSNHNLLDTLLI